MFKVGSTHVPSKDDPVTSLWSAKPASIFAIYSVTLYKTPPRTDADGRFHLLFPRTRDLIVLLRKEVVHALCGAVLIQTRAS